MRNLFKIGMVAIIMSVTATSCTSVETGSEAAIISYGGETNMSQTLPEGLHWGLNYLWDNTVPYVVKEQTYNYAVQLNDKNDMTTPVELVIYFQAQRGKVNKIHSLVGQDYKDEKLKAFIASVVGKVVPQYAAQDINKFKRAEVEQKITQLLAKEAVAIYVNVPRVNFTKVGIPAGVEKVATAIAVQLSNNQLAEKKEAEQVALAKAKVAQAQGDYDAGVLNAKTQDLLSQPKMLEKQRIDNERIMWTGYAKTGKSPFGENNIFGGSSNSSPMLMLQR